MAYTLIQAAKLSRNPLARGVMQSIVTTDEMLAVIPMVSKMGEAFRYNREKALPSAEFVSPTHTSLTESSATFDQVTVPMRTIITDVDVYLFAEQQQGDTNAQMAVQLEKKLKATGRLISQKLVDGGYAGGFTLSSSIAGVTPGTFGPGQDTTRQGPGSLFYDQSADTLAYRGPGDVTYGTPVDVSSDGTYAIRSDNPSKYITVTIVAASLPGSDAEVLVNEASTTEEWDGMEKLTPESQTVASSGANGDALTFEVMDQLIDEKVKSRENLHFVMPGALKRKYFSLMRALGGATPDHVQLPGLNRQVPTYRGIPILQNDYIPRTESKGAASTLSSIYLVDFVPEDGLYMGVGGSEENVVDGDPRDVRVMGLRVRSVGELENKEAMRTRVSFYGASALGSELAIARASELVTA